jgi:hypothetical protein
VSSGSGAAGSTSRTGLAAIVTDGHKWMLHVAVGVDVPRRLEQLLGRLPLERGGGGLAAELPSDEPGDRRPAQRSSTRREGTRCSGSCRSARRSARRRSRTAARCALAEPAGDELTLVDVWLDFPSLPVLTHWPDGTCYAPVIPS